MEETSSGSGAGLCAKGTQLRAPPEVNTHFSPFHHSNIPVFHYPTEFQKSFKES
jgi:hypothetical protein